MIVERIAQPLPAEIPPPHPDLGLEWRLSLTEGGLAVLAAIEVVHEALIGRFAERAVDSDARRASGGLTLVDRGEVGGAERLHKERRHAQHQSARRSEQQL